ncbi:MAG: GntR family transcriptional regulator [Nitrospinae bacterium]|nr:GntR family transcriptional regulator [Nitrospinota bacterium]
MKIGHMQKLPVDRMAEQGAYLGNDRDVVLLPKKYFPEKGLKVGDTIEVFLYTDSEDRPIATTLKPKAVVGDFAPLWVKDVNKYGAFLDWGLEKDLFVPYREQRKELTQGERHVFRVLLDDITNRVIATTKLGGFIQKLPETVKVGDKVSYLVFSLVEEGARVIVNNAYLGMLYFSEVFETLEIGAQGEAYIKKIRSDEKLDLILRPEGYKGSVAEADNLLEKLKSAGGFLPYNAKSSPFDIEEEFTMSKRDFKKIIGKLYKERKITITDKGMKLVATGDSSPVR